MPAGRALLCLRPRGVVRGAVLTLVFAGVLATGAATGALPRGDDAGREPRTGSGDRAAFDRAALHRFAAEAVADGKSGKQAAEEFVSRSGDRWGAVYDRREYAEFERSLDGAYTGVGLSAGRTSPEGGVEVTRVRSGGPAERAGVRVGDRLLAVGGQVTDGRSASEVVSLLRGDGVPGSTVALRISRGGMTWTQTLRRERLVTEPVTVTRPDPRTVVIRVAAFTKGVGARVREAVRTAPAGAGVLLDLRGNSGGLVDEAASAASAFLDGGLVATYDVEGEQRAVYAERGGDTGRPLVALVDGGTMSAAELLTGALQDRGRAVTVGSRTFGKGSVQMPSTLPDGSVAELTVGHYRTPAGHEVDGRGIAPDLPAAEGAEERARTVLSGLGGGS
ncbi:PDZ domain-containing protein [Streptomyces sp. R302]|uniref:S41 family peptidase n=1 Tax=unclassified Streptomyces TaxID=2593676 RepID=UPI00145E9223|nr:MULTISPECIES: S41 family peptidase [unclassified Streptomyces]NML48782.1 PDZ domain-containing protein [Streptomyces sp. R301]NML77109.1 PDZ domain-containing protein [Streptomyces sp. R302]